MGKYPCMQVQRPPQQPMCFSLSLREEDCNKEDCTHNLKTDHLLKPNEIKHELSFPLLFKIIKKTSRFRGINRLELNLGVKTLVLKALLHLVQSSVTLLAITFHPVTMYEGQRLIRPNISALEKAKACAGCRTVEAKQSIAWVGRCSMFAPT